MRKRHRGHDINWTGNTWTYAHSTPRLLQYGKERPCTKCGRISRGPDWCLGELPNVKAACCGHGVDEDAYITFYSGLTVRGKEVTRLRECWEHNAVDPETVIDIYHRLSFNVEATYKLCQAGNKGIHDLVEIAATLEMLVRKSVDVAGIADMLVQARKRSRRNFT